MPGTVKQSGYFSNKRRGGEEGRIRLDTRYIKNLGYSSRANNKITLPMDLGPLTPSHPMGATPQAPPTQKTYPHPTPNRRPLCKGEIF